MMWPYGEDEGPTPEQEREMDDDRLARIAWCRARDIDPFDIVCDGGIEAWQAVTDYDIARAVQK
jgi:hypothetical protein